MDPKDSVIANARRIVNIRTCQGVGCTGCPVTLQNAQNYLPSTLLDQLDISCSNKVEFCKAFLAHVEGFHQQINSTIFEKMAAALAE